MEGGSGRHAVVYRERGKKAPAGSSTVPIDEIHPPGLTLLTQTTCQLMYSVTSAKRGRRVESGSSWLVRDRSVGGMKEDEWTAPPQDASDADCHDELGVAHRALKLGPTEMDVSLGTVDDPAVTTHTSSS